MPAHVWYEHDGAYFCYRCRSFAATVAETTPDHRCVPTQDEIIERLLGERDEARAERDRLRAAITRVLASPANMGSEDIETLLDALEGRDE